MTHMIHASEVTTLWCYSNLFIIIIIFTARCYACLVGLSVSVRLSQVGVLSKRLNESSWFLACELPSTRPTPC